MRFKSPLSLIARWGVLLLYMGTIFYMASTPRPALLHYAPDYAWHFAGYFLLGFLAVRAFAKGFPAVVDGRAAVIAAVFSIAYAVSDEWHQSLVPGRFASFGDIVADSLGILLAIGFVVGYGRRRRPIVGGGLASELEEGHR